VLADRFYDETVAAKDKQGIVRRVGTIEQSHMEAAYLRGSQYHKERIEEFKPQFIVVQSGPIPEQLHNFL